MWIQQLFNTREMLKVPNMRDGRTMKISQIRSYDFFLFLT